ncbi:RNA polymerase sigma factor [Streptomyces longisporoflavus]|uniref:RNA polymerase sigma factor n=1 Tax=Streptomyces longisporoflavus TaxID=28044 RepID=A0ABW7R7N0_9ACTN
MSTQDPAEEAGQRSEPARDLAASGEQRAAYSAGVVRAYSDFYRGTVKQLVAYLIVSGAPAPIAADIAQDCMIELLKRWETIDHPRAYAYRTAGRMWGRRMATVQTEAPIEELPEPTSLVPRPDALADFETKHDMLQLLKALPLRQRQVLLLTFESFTPKEIADLLGLEPGTVRPHLMRARRTAASLIRDWEVEQ